MKHFDPSGTDRREFLRRLGCGFPSVAFAAICAEQAASAKGAENPLAPKTPHFKPRAKRVIFLWMQGGPAQMDLFDYKPRLRKESGDKIPFALSTDQDRFQSHAKLFAPVAGFQQRGQSGAWVTDMLPYLAGKVDDLCFLRGMQSDSSAHPNAIRQMQTGSVQFIRPSMGSWILYGLGTENQNLPGFVVISPVLYGDDGSPLHYNNAFLPAIYQGMRIGNSRVPVKESKVGYLGDPEITSSLQRQELDFVQMRNRRYIEDLGGDQNVEGLVQSYELAFRMQMEAPAVFDIGKESKATHELYGIGDDATDNYGRKCLMARRLIEAGVRFVQVTDGAWDHHAKIRSLLRKSCTGIDKPIAGLLTDLKARGLLEDTLVVWTGEFGRTPYDQDLMNGKGNVEDRGRDHNPYCWTMWMAGTGVKHGMTYGDTDEYAWKAIDGKVHVHDLHATLLHILGLNHEKLTYRYSGRDFRLTDVSGKVVHEILS
jgi:hypothetical protein